MFHGGEGGSSESDGGDVSAGNGDCNNENVINGVDNSGVMVMVMIVVMMSAIETTMDITMEMMMMVIIEIL